jgi:hypothetical protein
MHCVVQVRLHQLTTPDMIAKNKGQQRCSPTASVLSFSGPYFFRSVFEVSFFFSNKNVVCNAYHLRGHIELYFVFFMSNLADGIEIKIRSATARKMF